jgi:GTP-binding protein
MEQIAIVRKAYEKTVSTRSLNTFIKEMNINEKIRYVKGKRGKRGKLKYMTQTGTKPPSFLVFCNDPGFIRKKYSKFILNSLRETFSFDGVPIRISFRKE